MAAALRCRIALDIHAYEAPEFYVAKYCWSIKNQRYVSDGVYAGTTARTRNGYYSCQAPSFTSVTSITIALFTEAKQLVERGILCPVV